jgi:predicted nuclease of predicted toxin-antitoxin system
LTRVLLDQGCPRSTAQLLRLPDWDVVHVGAVGLARASDREILDHARKDNRVCVTLDADFHAILAVTSATSPSVVRIRIEGLDARGFAALILRIWPSIANAVEVGALVTVRPDAVRVRRLPI